MDWKENESWFYDVDDIPDTALIYKGTIDGTDKHPKKTEQFVEQLQNDIYDHGYERTTEATYKNSCDALFPGMSEEEQILWMSLLTGQEWWYWFQEEGEITQTWKDKDINFTNKCIDKNRSCLLSLASDRYFVSWSLKSSLIAIPSSRSVG